MLFSICVYMRKTKKHKKKSLFLRLKNNKTKSPMDGIQRHSQFLFAAVCEVCRIFYFVVSDVQLYIVHFSCCLVIVNWVRCCCGILCFVKLIELSMKSRVDLEARKNHRRSVKPLWYFLKYALLHIIVLYFWIRIWKMPQLFVASQPNKSNIQIQQLVN